MNKVTRTVAYLTKTTGQTEFTLDQLFNAQQAAIDVLGADPNYVAARAAILVKHNMTEQQWQAVLAELQTQYYTTLPDNYRDVNRDLHRLCIRFSISEPEYERSMFAAHATDAANNGTVSRRKNDQGRYVYSLPK